MSQHPDPARGGTQGDEEDFIRMRLAGGRFDHHLVPFDVLSDLAAYREIVIDLARHLFRRAHPNRQKVPRGFAESFQLGIASLSPGNSVTLASRRFTERNLGYLEDQADLPFPEFGEFFAARNMIFDVILRTNGGLELPEDFPVALASKFNKFGRNFRADEFIELSEGGRTPVRYTGETRKNIVLKAGNSYEGHVEGEFTLDGGRQTEQLIHLVSKDVNLVDLPVQTPGEWAALFSKVGQSVRITGVGLYDRQDRLTRITEYEEILSGPPEPVTATSTRLEKIAQIPAGWYNGGNPAPAATAVRSMKLLLEEMEISGVPRPYLYPLPEGGVVAEWSFSGWEISITVEPDASAAEFLAVSTEGLDDVEELIYLDAEDLGGVALRVWAIVNPTEAR
ncbi:hypothetical protein ACUDCE_19470 [Stenotrophomonas pavanii]|uniref:hypothetical protein n=1 Tax=Stenotrophomonas pavanii TaxID=487698 RepID=UPI000B1B6039|nr:hypothetical protein [Stenotrophomonas maltophilia]